MHGTPRPALTLVLKSQTCRHLTVLDAVLRDMGYCTQKSQAVFLGTSAASFSRAVSGGSVARPLELAIMAKGQWKWETLFAVVEEHPTVAITSSAA